jgi:hypothetical protein
LSSLFFSVFVDCDWFFSGCTRLDVEERKKAEMEVRVQQGEGDHFYLNPYFCAGSMFCATKKKKCRREYPFMGIFSLRSLLPVFVLIHG